MNKDSFLSTALRSFAATFAKIFGFGLALLALLTVMSALQSSTEADPTIEYSYSLEVAPNAKGVRKLLSKETPVILQIDINGMIGTELLSRQTIEQQLVESNEQILKNDRVKALLLKIDSPGGTVTDADGIYRLIKAYKAQHKVPVFAFVDGLCASGGMYIACAADQVFATNTSIIGSVGVLIPTLLNVSTLLDKVGVQSLTLSAGKGKYDLNPLRPWKPGEQDNMQELVNYYYDAFVSIVTENRPKIKRELLIKDYGAKVFPAKTAQEYGYIDETGKSFDEVIALLAKKIGIDDDYYQVLTFKSKNWWASLFSASFPLRFGTVKHEVSLPGQLPEELQNQWLYLFRP